jgi:uncharacterized protein YjbJ (UPF0337 family)
MGELASEVEGTMKEAYGTLRHDARLQAAGANEASTARARRKLTGIVDEAVGTVEEHVGASVGAPLLTAKGEARRVRGSIKRAG